MGNWMVPDCNTWAVLQSEVRFNSFSFHQTMWE